MVLRRSSMVLLACALLAACSDTVVGPSATSTAPRRTVVEEQTNEVLVTPAADKTDTPPRTIKKAVRGKSRYAMAAN